MGYLTTWEVPRLSPSSFMELVLAVEEGGEEEWRKVWQPRSH